MVSAEWAVADATNTEPTKDMSRNNKCMSHFPAYGLKYVANLQPWLEGRSLRHFSFRPPLSSSAIIIASARTTYAHDGRQLVRPADALRDLAVNAVHHFSGRLNVTLLGPPD